MTKRHLSSMTAVNYVNLLSVCFDFPTDKPVTVTLIPGEETVIEGGSVVMECAANSNPAPNKYTWLKRQMGQVNEINSTEREMFYSNITRDTSLSCMAHNSFGVGQSDWLDLHVQCKKNLSFLH